MNKKFNIVLMPCEGDIITEEHLHNCLNGTMIEQSAKGVDRLLLYKREIIKTSSKSSFKSFGIQIQHGETKAQSKIRVNAEWQYNEDAYTTRLAAITNPVSFFYLEEHNKQFVGKDKYTVDKGLGDSTEIMEKLYYNTYITAASLLEQKINYNSVEALLCGVIPSESKAKKVGCYCSNILILLADYASGQNADALGALSLDWKLTCKKALRSPKLSYDIQVNCRSVYYSSPEQLEHDYQMTVQMK